MSYVKKDSKADLIIIQGQYKIIHQDLWPYASIYAFKNENNDLENNNSGNDVKNIIRNNNYNNSAKYWE